MLNFEGKAIYLACGATNMLCGIDALAAVVQGSFNLTPMSDAIFIFCNAIHDRIKILEWDGDGFWLWLRFCSPGDALFASLGAKQKWTTLISGLSVGGFRAGSAE